MKKEPIIIFVYSSNLIKLYSYNWIKRLPSFFLWKCFKSIYELLSKDVFTSKVSFVEDL